MTNIRPPLEVPHDAIDDLIELYGAMEYRARCEPGNHSLIYYTERLDAILDAIYSDRKEDL